MAELLVFLAPLESTCVDTKMAVWCFVLFCVARSRTRTTTHLYVNRFAVASQCTHTSEPVHTGELDEPNEAVEFQHVVGPDKTHLPLRRKKVTHTTGYLRMKDDAARKFLASILTLVITAIPTWQSQHEANLISSTMSRPASSDSECGFKGGVTTGVFSW